MELHLQAGEEPSQLRPFVVFALKVALDRLDLRRECVSARARFGQEFAEMADFLPKLLDLPFAVRELARDCENAFSSLAKEV